MSTNGFEGRAMTGSGTNTTETLSWLSSVAPSQAQVPHTTSTVVTTLASGHDPHHLLQAPSPGSIQTPSVFRPPPPVAEPSARHYSSSQYGPAYSSTSSALPVYSPSIYSHQASQLSSLAQYAGYFPHYHAFPGGSSLLPSPYPSPEASQVYSDALRSMGSHLQQHGSPQLPRSPFLTGPLPHSYGTRPVSSPGPNLPQALNPALGGSHHLALRRDSKSPSRDLPQTVSPLKDAKHSQSGKMYSVPTQESKDTGYKVFKDPRRPARHTVTFEGDLPQAQHSPPHRPLGPPLPKKRHKEPSSSASSAESGSASTSSLRRPSPSQQAPGPAHPHYPPHFMKGSIIQLASGQLKYVEDLRTEDFVSSADVSSDLKIDSSTVVRVEESLEKGTVQLGFLVGEHRVQVTVEAALEHPFFVFGQGWSSCSPERTLQRYGLSCQHLTVGDVCISLTHKDANSRAAELSAQRQQPANQISASATDPGPQLAAPSETHTSLPGESNRRAEERSEVAHGQGLSPAETRPAATTSPVRDSPPEEESTSAQGEGTPPRKRRWSAPDQISVDSDSEDAPPMPEVSSSSAQRSPTADPGQHHP